MSVKSGVYLKSIFDATAAMGDKIISSEATFEPEGFEHMGLLTKQFPWPELSPAGEIEVPMQMGAARWQPQQLKVNQQGAVTLMETEAGHVKAFLQDIVAQGAWFNAKVYEGTADDYKRVESLRSCFFVLDPADRDWENRAQILLITGTLFYHYFANQ